MSSNKDIETGDDINNNEREEDINSSDDVDADDEKLCEEVEKVEENEGDVDNDGENNANLESLKPPSEAKISATSSPTARSDAVSKGRAAGLSFQKGTRRAPVSEHNDDEEIEDISEAEKVKDKQAENEDIEEEEEVEPESERNSAFISSREPRNSTEPRNLARSKPYPTNDALTKRRAAGLPYQRRNRLPIASNTESNSTDEVALRRSKGGPGPGVRQSAPIRQPVSNLGGDVMVREYNSNIENQRSGPGAYSENYRAFGPRPAWATDPDARISIAQLDTFPEAAVVLDDNNEDPSSLTEVKIEESIVIADAVLVEEIPIYKRRWPYVLLVVAIIFVAWPLQIMIEQPSQSVASVSPSRIPPIIPSEEPSRNPSRQPIFSHNPTETPSLRPTGTPSVTPSEIPTASPSFFPTLTPDETPSEAPSISRMPTTFVFFGQRAFLSTIYFLANGGNWTDNSLWLTSKPNSASANKEVCDWYGVTCEEDGKVTEVDLHSNNLIGELRQILSCLTDINTISFLDLSGNPYLNTDPVGYNIPDTTLGCLTKETLDNIVENFCEINNEMKLVLDNVNCTCCLDQPSMFPSTSPTLRPSSKPTNPPSTLPSFTPSHLPSSSLNPSNSPSVFSSQIPTKTPSINPSHLPSFYPSSIPTKAPSINPSNSPSVFSSQIPTKTPSINPSHLPSFYHSPVPTKAPLINPSINLSTVPSINPSTMPTKIPSINLSMFPSFYPSLVPTKMKPSEFPSFYPSQLPTNNPSMNPSGYPSRISSSP